MKVLILGGSRFIGLHLVRLLHSQGHQVSVLNRGQTQADFPDGVTRLHADRTNPSEVRSALSGSTYDTAFDISGYTPDSLKPVVESLEGNVGRFVFCSTTSVYAPSDLVPIEEGFPLYRSPDASQYARDKVDCEDFLNEAYESRKFPMTILRPPYVYGPDNYIAEREFSFFARLTQSRKVIIPGDGLNLIHPVHVDDLADAFAAVPGRSNTLGQTYTIASPDVITTRGFVRVIGEVMGADVNLVHVEPREYEALGRAFYPYEWAASQVYSIEKAKHGLEWSPRYHMRDGLEMTYRWWLKQGLDKEPWDFSDEDQALSRIKD